MSAKHVFILLIICSIGLFGCPYESQVPISAPYLSIDSKMLGSWQSKDEVYNSYYVSRLSETEYRIIQKNISNTSAFKGYLSEIRGNMFMNLYSDSSRTWYLYKIKIDPDGNRFTLFPFAENLPEHFASTEGLHSYVEKNMNFQSFYNEKDILDFQRIEGSKPTASN